MVHCWTAADAASAINGAWGDPGAWDRGERSWHEGTPGFFSPNADGTSFAYVEIR